MKSSKPKAKSRAAQAMLGILEKKRDEALSYRQLSQLTGIPKGTLAWWAHRLRKKGILRGGEFDVGGRPRIELRRHLVLRLGSEFEAGCRRGLLGKISSERREFPWPRSSTWRQG